MPTARVPGFAVSVRVAGLVGEDELTDSQLPELMVLALKLVPDNPVSETVWVTGLPKATPERLTGLGLATKPAVEPGASTVMGIISVGLAELVELMTMLPVLRPGPSLLALMPTPMDVGVVSEVAA